MMTTKTLQWKVHTPNLLKEILTNNETGILLRPIQIFANLLAQVGERATQINDDELNALMIRLTLYSCADPTHDDYDSDLCKEILKDG